jgi:hypothetical protein
MRIALVIIILFSYGFCGAVKPTSPCIDAGSENIPQELLESLSLNGLPVVGKYPGDKPDIGAWEWFPGVDCSNPKGDWDGVPLNYNPREGVPLLPPLDLRVIP